MITYSTNWMGPVNMDWYRQRGLTVTKTVVQEEDSKYTDRKRGDVYEIEEITQRWAGGRIDVRGEGLGPYGEELGLPIMSVDCYNSFSDWLQEHCTEKIWSLDKLVECYEKTNPKIVWAKDVFGVEE